MTAATMRVTQKLEVDIPDLPLKIRQARQAKGMSIIALHKASGVSRISLSKFENGQASAIAYSTVQKIEAALDCDFGVKF